MYNVYQQHRGSNIKMPKERDIESVRGTAEASARLGHNAFYRVFEIIPDSITGERFVTAFSVLDGVVKEHKSVTFPAAHFAYESAS